MELKQKLEEMTANAENLLKNGSIDEASEIYREIILKAGDDNCQVIILSLLRLGEIATDKGNIDMAIEYYKEVEERSLTESFTTGLLDAVSRRATLLMASGRWIESLKATQQGLAQSKALDEAGFEMTFYGLLGQIERRLGNYDNAIAYALNGLKLAQSASDYDEELTFLSDLALISLAKNDFKEVVKQAESGLRRAKETDRLARSVVFLGQKSQALLRSGKIDEACTIAKEGLEAALDHSTTKEVSTFYHDLAQIYLLKKDNSTALENALKAFKGFSELSNKEGTLATLRTLNRALLLTDDLDGAFNGLVDALVLSMTMHEQLFFATFKDVTYFIAVLCEDKKYDAIESGIGIIKGFLDSVKKELEAEGSNVEGEKHYLSYVEQLFKACIYACNSKGDKEAGYAKDAFSTAEKIDKEYGGDSKSLIELFYK